MTFEEVKSAALYELYAKEIYTRLLKANGHQIQLVKHQAKLMGKSGVEHKLDVYFEIIVEGQLQKIAIECKYLKRTVDLDAARSFNYMLNDIGDVTGIFLTKEGYQSGPIKLFNYDKVEVNLLREPRESEWEGRLRGITYNIQIPDASVSLKAINLDHHWIAKNFERFKRFAINDKLPIQIEYSDENYLLDADGNEVTLLQSLKSEAILKCYPKGIHTHKVDFEDGYLEFGIGLVKVVSLEYLVESRGFHEESVDIDADLYVDSILKNIQTGEIQFIRKE